MMAHVCGQTLLQLNSSDQAKGPLLVVAAAGVPAQPDRLPSRGYNTPLLEVKF